MFEFKIFLLLLIIMISFYKATECPLKKESQDYTIIQDFDSFNQLNFSKCEKFLKTSMLEMIPNKEIILDLTLNFTGLKISTIGKFFGIALRNIKGLDYKFNSFDKILLTHDKGELSTKISHIFSSSNFDIYINNQILNTEKCKYEYFKKNDFFVQFFYRKVLPQVFFKSNVKYSEQTCPLIFYLTRIKLLDIDWITSNSISKNILSFTRITENIYLASEIFQFSLRLYHFDLTTKLLNEDVFKNLIALDINGQINSIQYDLFKYFEKLKMIRFRTQNVKGLFTHKNKWLNSLNSKVTKIYPDDINQYLDEGLILAIFQTYSNETFYDYPNHDFCYFKDFPHQRLVIPKLKPNYKSSCTCTELFLVQYSKELIKNIEYYNDQLIDNYYFLDQYYYNEIHEDIYSKCINSSFEKNLIKCDFKKRLQLCNITNLNNNNFNDLDQDSFLYMEDWRQTSLYLDHYFSIYFNPVLAFVCILINIFMILILSGKNIKKEMRFIYMYLKIHSISNLIYIILVYFDLMGLCVKRDLFCSSLYNSIYIQYINVYILKLFKGFLTTFSNITYTSFILTRYIKISDNKNNLLKKFSKISLKLYLSISILFSVMINIYNVFEYSTDIRASFHRLERSQVLNPGDKFVTNMSKFQYTIFNILQYIKIIFSDLLFYIVSIIIDVYLIYFIQISINNAIAFVVNPASNQNLIMKKKSKSKIRTMIILNGLNFFILRFPLLLIDVYGLFFSLNYKGKNEIKYSPDLNSYLICRTFGFCHSLKSIFYFFYLLSFLFQFFLFLKFDSNFYESIKIIKSRLF